MRVVAICNFVVKVVKTFGVTRVNTETSNELTLEFFV